MATFTKTEGADMDVKYLKQVNVYKNFVYNLNDVFGIDSVPCSKEENW